MLAARLSDLPHHARAIPKSVSIIRCSGTCPIWRAYTVSHLSVEKTPACGHSRGITNGGDNGYDKGDRHAGWVAARKQPGSVFAVDIVHHDPKATVVPAAVMYTHNMWVPQFGGELSLPQKAPRKPGSEMSARSTFSASPRPRMLGQIDLAHPAQPSDRTIV